jgi:RNA polymerase sigma factor (sigma-70 family)
MLAALSSLRASPIEGAFKPWLFRIAHNESISIIRGRSRAVPASAVASAVAVTDDLETREELRTLVSDIAALPHRQRGAIVMRELNGLSYAQIAAALGISEAAGKQLVYEARTALHDQRAGHEMDCQAVRERISANDRRLLRGRMVRAHLRGCQACQDFERGIERRRRALPLLVPPLAPVLAAGVLTDVFGAGGSGSAASGGGAAGATGVAASGSTFAGSAALKLVAAGLVAGAASAGAYTAGTAIVTDLPTLAGLTVKDGTSGPTVGLDGSDGTIGSVHAGAGGGGDFAVGNRAGTSAPGSDTVGGNGLGGGDPAAPGGDGPGGAGDDPGDGPGDPGGGPGGGDPGGGPGGGGDPGGPPGGGGDPGGPPGGGGEPGGGGDPGGPPGGGGGGDPGGPPGGGGGGGSGGGSGGGGSGGGGGGGSGGGGGGGAPPGTPPGHGGTPPGQGGTPPGQAKGDTPPGHINNPGKGKKKP